MLTQTGRQIDITYIDRQQQGIPPYYLYRQADREALLTQTDRHRLHRQADRQTLFTRARTFVSTTFFTLTGRHSMSHLMCRLQYLALQSVMQLWVILTVS